MWQLLPEKPHQLFHEHKAHQQDHLKSGMAVKPMRWGRAWPRGWDHLDFHCLEPSTPIPFFMLSFQGQI